MDWIHCNRCFCQPVQGSEFLLTNCGHIFCNSCFDQAEGKCKVCDSDCRCIRLVADMKQEVKDFFSEPDEMVKKLGNIMDFQKEHRMRLTAHWMSLNKKYLEAKSEIRRLSMITEKMYKDLKEVVKQNKELKAELKSFECTGRKLSNDYSSPTQTFSLQRSGNSGLSFYKIDPSKSLNSQLVTPMRLNRPYNRNYGSPTKRNENSSSREAVILLTPPSSTNTCSKR